MDDKRGSGEYAYLQSFYKFVSPHAMYTLVFVCLVKIPLVYKAEFCNNFPNDIGFSLYPYRLEY